MNTEIHEETRMRTFNSKKKKKMKNTLRREMNGKRSNVDFTFFLFIEDDVINFQIHFFPFQIHR